MWSIGQGLEVEGHVPLDHQSSLEDNAVGVRLCHTNSGSTLGKVSSARIRNHAAHPRSRRNGLSGDHHNFPALRNCQQLGYGCTTDLPGTTEDHCGESLLHP